MKKLFTLLLLILLAGVFLVACEDKEEELPKDNDETEEVIPEEDNNETEDEIVYEDKVIVDESNLDKGIFKTVTLNVEGYNQIKITISGTSNYDIPVNINNFKVDGKEVEYGGVSGNIYLIDHEFKIGELNAVGRLINIHNNDLRLHTTHKTHGEEHYIIVNVEDISEFELQYKVTTNAYSYMTSLNIELLTN